MGYYIRKREGKTNQNGGGKMKWSGKLQAVWFLKSVGLISCASDAKYLGCHGADYVFGLSCGDVVAVDLVLKSHRVNGVRV